jgi:hypothetical protein
MELCIHVAGKAKQATFKVLRTEENTDEVAVLFGRTLLNLFRIVIVDGSRVSMDGKTLYEPRRDCVRRVMDALGEPDLEFTEAGIVPLDPVPSGNSDSVVFEIEPAQASFLENALLELTRMPPQPLPRCPGKISLRPLGMLSGVLSVPDTSNQKFSFVIELDHPPDQCLDPPRLYAGPMYRKLSLDDKKKFADQVGKYVEAKWWTPADVESAKPHGPPSNVFGVKQKDKLRLVVDFRQRNRAYPSTTSPPLISFSLALLRTLPKGSIIVADAAAAFYHTRATDPAWLHLGPLGDYLSHRVSFGLSYGPEALDASLGTLWNLYTSIVPSGTGARFVDDMWAHAPDAESYVDESLKVEESNVAIQSLSFNSLLHIMDLCGYNVESRKFQQSRMNEHDEPLNLLGMSIRYVTLNGTSASCIDCGRTHLKEFPLDKLATRPTKQMIFQLCGVLSYDPLRSHLEAKLASDLLRSVVGRYGDWKGAVLDLNEFSNEDKALYLALLDWIREIIANERTCEHAIPVPMNQNALKLRVMTDASHAGAGFVLQIAPRGDTALNGNDVKWFTIWADCWFWKRAELNYHVNRLEAACLYRALKTTSKFIDIQSSSRFGNSVVPVDLIVLNDNSTAVSWSHKPPACDGTESRAIERISAGLRLEVYYLRQTCRSFELRHVAGSDNTEADLLSRYLERPFGNETLNTLIRKRNISMVKKGKLTIPIEELLQLPGDPTDAPPSVLQPLFHQHHKDSPGGGLVLLDQDIDTVRRVRAPLPEPHGHHSSWVEEACSSSYDVGDLCRTAAVLRFCLKFWKSIVNDSIPLPLFPVLFTHSDKLAVVRSAQRTMGTSAEVSGEGELVFDPGSEVIYLKRPLPTGQYQYLPYIPSKSALQNVIIRDAHRRCGHMGVDYTLAQASEWAIQRPIKKAVNLLSTCLHCQMKNAKRSTNAPVTLISDLSDCDPFTYWALDHLSLGNKVNCLSMQDIVTGFCLFAVCDHSFSSTWDAFVNLLDRTPRRPLQILTDKAAVFAQVVERFQRTYGVPCEHITTSGHAAFENGKLERLHQTGLSVLSTKLYMHNLKFDKADPGSSPLLIQRTLDSCSSILNSRPLGQIFVDSQSSRYMITPNTLVFGDSPGIIDCSDSTFQRNSAAIKWLSHYRSVYWQRLKARSCANQAKRAKKVQWVANEPILYFAPKGKLDLGYKIGHVRSLHANRLEIVTSEGKTKFISVHNCVKLKLLHSTEPAPYDTNFCGARVSVRIDSVEYLGTIIEHAPDGLVLVRWDVRADGCGWLDELLPPSELEFVGTGHVTSRI